MDNGSQIQKLLIADIKHRLIIESVPRIEKCLSQLSFEQIWYRPNDSIVSIGNLILHLCGNVRQWILMGLGGAEDVRQRDDEFVDAKSKSAFELKQMLNELMLEVSECLDQLTQTILERPVTIQGIDETGVSVLIHVTEHFSYHVGQITTMTKLMKDIQLGYYDEESIG